MVFNESQKINNLGFKVMFAVTLIPMFLLMYQDVKSNGGFSHTDIVECFFVGLFMVLV